MKYNQFLLLLLPVICSCSQDKTMDKLTQTDSLLDRLETDSVKKMLCGIDTLNTHHKSLKPITNYYIRSINISLTTIFKTPPY